MWRTDRGIEKMSAAYIPSWSFFFHFAYHRLWRGSMSLEVFMILFDVSFLFDSDVELTSILSYSMHIVTQSRCSLLFVSAADGDLCHTKGPRLLRIWVTVRFGKNEAVMIAVIALTWENSWPMYMWKWSQAAPMIGGCML